MFFPFKNYRIEERLFNDTNAILFTTPSDVRTIIFVETLSNLDFSGASVARIFIAGGVSPTTKVPNIDIWKWDYSTGGDGVITTSSPVILPGSNVNVSGGSYTARVRMHIFELPII